MKPRDAIAWFKTTFGDTLEEAVAGTPFSVDMLAAIAYQETGYIWSVLVDKQLSLQKVLELCVGDTIDAPGRSEFPASKAQLVAAPRGQEMFRIARQALVDMAQYIPSYTKVVRNPDKFCHGYGIFQYDLQFFKDDPAFFLEKKWCDIAACIGKLLVELREAMRRQCLANKSALSDTEKVYVAIAYNKGRAKPALGFKQGYKSDDGRYYGENVFEYLRIAQTIGVGAPAKLVATSALTRAPLPPPTPVEATDDVYEVDVRGSTLRLRSEPRIDKRDPRANVIAELPAGQMVVRISGKKADEFFEVETSLNGAHFRGFAAAEYLRPVKVPKAIPVVAPAAVAPTAGIVAVYMPREAGMITRRADSAGPYSLNEPGQPQRDAESAAERCAQLAAIIDWLAVDKPAH